MSLELKVLGSVAPYPKGDNKCPGYLINYNDNKYLFDLGNGAISNMDLKEDLKRLKVFISHLHPDHYGDLTALAQAALVYKRLGYIDEKIKVYLPNGDKRTESVYVPGDPYNHDDWGRSYSEERNSIEYEYLNKLEKDNPIRIEGYRSLDLKDGDITIKTEQTEHPIKSYAFKIITPEGTIVYSGDTGYSSSLIEFAKDSDLFICESSLLRGQYRQDNSHLYAYEAATIAKKANVQQLLLTHFWPEIDKSEYLKEAKEIFDNVEVAEENKILKLSKRQ